MCQLRHDPFSRCEGFAGGPPAPAAGAAMNLVAAALWLALAGHPMPSTPGSVIVLRPGETLKFAVPCEVKRVHTVNGPFHARQVHRDLIQIEAFAQGSGTVTVWCTDGQRLDYPVNIKAR